MKTAVLLSGCGVYDGTEIHEAVLALLALSQNNLDFICTAPDINKYHVLPVDDLNTIQLNQHLNHK